MEEISGTREEVSADYAGKHCMPLSHGQIRYSNFQTLASRNLHRHFRQEILRRQRPNAANIGQQRYDFGRRRARCKSVGRAALNLTADLRGLYQSIDDCATNTAKARSLPQDVIASVDFRASP